MSKHFWTAQETATALEMKRTGFTSEETACKMTVDACGKYYYSPAAVRGIWKRADETPSTIPAPANAPTAETYIAAREAKEDANKTKSVMKDLATQLKDARARQSFIDAANSYREPPTVLPPENSTKRELTAVVLASDWHVEETIDGASVAFKNEYNLEVAERRIAKFFNAIVWNIKHHRADGYLNIDNLILWLGGDLMTGYIHEELLENNSLSPTETMLWLLPKLRSGILTLLDRLSLTNIYIPCSYGNHGRTTQKPRISGGHANSFEWLMYHNLAALFEGDDRVTFHITASAHQYVDVYNYRVHFHHGDDVKYFGGVGGLGVPLLKAVPAWDSLQPSHYHCIGHHHTLLDYGRVVVNGSLIGYGPYSQRIRAGFELPQQAMFYIDSKRGKCMTTALWVD